MTDPLNTLFQILTTSLPAYLYHARPFAEHDSEPLRAAIRKVAEEEASLAVRVARAVRAEGGSLVLRGFPTEFTSLNDLSPRYLATQIIQRQEQDIQRIERIAEDLDGKPHQRAVAKDVLRAVKQHKKTLEELTTPESTST